MVAIGLGSKLLQSRIIFISEEINAETVTRYQAQLIYLTSNMTNKESEKNPIQIYINSPGGEIYSALGLYDLMQKFISSGYIIKTVNVGLAASAAAIILMSGSKGYRHAMPNCRVLLHQPSSGTWGTVTDMKIDLEECDNIKSIINNIVLKHANQDLIPSMERDKWLSAKESLKYNIIDSIL